MADFTQKSVIKSAERKLTTSIDMMANFVTLVNNFISTNPLGCVSYTSGGQAIAGVVMGTEYYSEKVVYEDALAKTVGQISIKAPTSSGFSTDISTIIATSALNTAMGGTPSHDSSEDSFSCVVKCHHSNGENDSITFKRDAVTVASYESDAILTAVETWADSVSALA
ncbi:MAG: hypothetical protein V1862_13330 [Methanobacteriota archaeon]